MVNKQLVFVVSVFALMSLSIVGMYYYQDKFDSPLSLKTKKGIVQSSGTKKMKVVLSMGTDQSVGLSVAIPYTRKEEFDDLIQNYPRIKNDFLLKVKPGQMDGWVKTRDFKAIKKKILEIVNGRLKTPVDTLYLESFNFH